MNSTPNSNADAALTYRAPEFNPPDPDAGVGKDAFASDTRLPYQRDLGRIIHSASFRRLQTKTQVMGTGEGDFHRTRLTHSLEVGQIGRGIVWNLHSRTDARYQQYLPSSELIEAICYSHDLGHPPYGHAGERALYKKMRGHGGFEGNAQTIRILTRLEKYYKSQGIRPTRRLLLGVLKYPVAYSEYPTRDGDKPPKCYYDLDKELIHKALSIFKQNDVNIFCAIGANDRPKYKSFDCSIMELADDIAYGVHDLEDGIGRRILTREEIGDSIKEGFERAGVAVIREVSIDALIDKLFSTDSCERKHAISLLVGYFIMDVNVKERGVFESRYLDLEAVVNSDNKQLLDHLSKKITFGSIVRRREVQTLEYKGEKIISELFDAFSERPLQLCGKHALDPFGSGVSEILERAESDKVHWSKLGEEANAVARSISDYIAGMTNPYAEKYYRRLFEPGFGSSTDEL